MTRTDNRAWNLLVSHLTRGLLYGRDVPKPAWYKTERKRARTRILNGRPAIKREAIFNRMKLGWTIDQITADLLIARTYVTQSIIHICKQERVQDRHQLAAKLGWQHPQPLSGREKHLHRGRERAELVQSLLLEGLSYEQICRRANLQLWHVRQIASRIYKKHGLKKGEGRPALGKKFGIELNRFAHSRAAPHPRIASHCLQ